MFDDICIFARGGIGWTSVSGGWGPGGDVLKMADMCPVHINKVKEIRCGVCTCTVDNQSLN